MEVRIGELLVTQAAGALAATVAVAAVFTIEILREGDGKGHRTHPLLLHKEHGVGEAVLIHHLHQTPLERVIPVYLTKAHIKAKLLSFRNFCNRTAAAGVCPH